MYLLRLAYRPEQKLQDSLTPRRRLEHTDIWIRMVSLNIVEPVRLLKLVSLPNIHDELRTAKMIFIVPHVAALEFAPLDLSKVQSPDHWRHGREVSCCR